MENRCYGGIAKWGHFTYHNLYTIGFDCHSFLFIPNKSPYKEICPLSTFRGARYLNISVTEVYVLKGEIFVIVLFAIV